MSNENECSPVGGSWDEFKKEIYTKEEIAASGWRVKEMLCATQMNKFEYALRYNVEQILEALIGKNDLLGEHKFDPDILQDTLNVVKDALYNCE